VVPVNCCVVGREVRATISPGFRDTVVGQVVALQADEFDARGTGWSVTAVGVAEEVERPAGADPWPEPGRHALLVRLNPAILTGSTITDSLPGLDRIAAAA
jgi:hypothetical protein